jgi:TonB family protein
MKRILPPLLTLPILLGACSTAYRSSAQLPESPAVRTADLDTAWGKRPSYDQKGQYFYPVKPRADNLRDEPGSGGVVVDVLVNRDGTVKYLALVTSSGSRWLDGLAVEVLRESRYSLILTPELPAPYVVRHKFNFYTGTEDHDTSYSSGNGYNTGSIDTRNSPQSDDPGNSNTVNGFTR